MEQDSRKIIAKLKRDGFELVKVKGSHHKLKKMVRLLLFHILKKSSDWYSTFYRTTSRQVKKGEEE